MFVSVILTAAWVDHDIDHLKLTILRVMNTILNFKWASQKFKLSVKMDHTFIKTA